MIAINSLIRNGEQFMSGYVYLVRNGDLFKIGSTKNLDNKLLSLKPDEIVQTIRTTDYKGLEARLLRRYKSKRIPETNYFRLDEIEILECKEQISSHSLLPNTLDNEFRIVIIASILFFGLFLLLSLIFDLNLFITLSASILVASLPMLVFLFVGNFGGYYSRDFSLFSTWSNRIKALIISSFLLSMSFTIYQFNIYLNSKINQ